MNMILAFMVAATVSLQTVKLGTAPGKTMVVTGATVSAHTEITNTVTKGYVESLGIEAGISAPGATNIAEGVVREGVRTNYLCTVAAAQAKANAARDAAKGYADGKFVEKSGVKISLSFFDPYNNHTGMVEFNGDGDIALRSFDTNVSLYGLDYIAFGTWNGGYSYLIPDDSNVATSNMVHRMMPKTASDVGAASQDELAPIAIDARNAYGYSRGTYLYMNANTNSWFSGTNYVFGADATNRTHFVWENGMDASTVPCSMTLNELRDGAKQIVWDQRDWTVWYWNFKAAQMNARIQEQMAASNAAIMAEISSTNNHAWAKWYASSGRVNPDPTTTFVDTPRVCLSPGMSWETVAEVSGCGYWTIVGNGLVIGGSGTNAVLEIKDFEGNVVMTVTKGAHSLAWLESEDFTGQMTDGNGWVCFDMLSDSQPTGYFSTTLDENDFVVQTDDNCPAQYTWENLGNGKWRVHFLLKPGIVSNRCFAKFLSEVQGQTKVTYNAASEISGGLIYNGRKIAPVVTDGAVVGDTIIWKVVQ